METYRLYNDFMNLWVNNREGVQNFLCSLKPWELEALFFDGKIGDKTAKNLVERIFSGI